MKKFITNATIGIDLGDQTIAMVVLEDDGSILERKKIKNTTPAIQKSMKPYPGAVVALETGTHSPWIYNLLTRMGHEVLVANASELAVIYKSKQKNDFRDAEILARLARFDRAMLHPIQHISQDAMADRAIINARNNLVEIRAKMINSVRSTMKTFGYRIPSCSAPSFHHNARNHIPDVLQPALFPLLDQMERITQTIREYDTQIHYLTKEKYPQTQLLTQVRGVGPITALTFFLTIEDPFRFKKSRQVGAFLGLTPRQDQSGACDKQLRITRAGNSYLRQLLVNCSNYIMGPFGHDCDLRRYGERLCLRGGQNARRRAKVAVARKLAVLLHCLWIGSLVYEPFYNQIDRRAA